MVASELFCAPLFRSNGWEAERKESFKGLRFDEAARWWYFGRGRAAEGLADQEAACPGRQALVEGTSSASYPRRYAAAAEAHPGDEACGQAALGRQGRRCSGGQEAWRAPIEILLAVDVEHVRLRDGRALRIHPEEWREGQ